MKNIACFIILSLLLVAAHAQTGMSNSAMKAKKDSMLRAAMHADSIAIEKQFAEEETMQMFFSKAEYPLLKEAKMGGVVPVANPTEVPDPTLQYKLLFEVSEGNPDSTKNQVDGSLSEVARIINLHLAAGIPVKNIIPVIVGHGRVLNAFRTNASYRAKFKLDNPNLKLLDEFRKIGIKFIACGQAMAFQGITKEELLPDVKISLTAQTVLSSYQLKGFVLKKIVLE